MCVCVCVCVCVAENIDTHLSVVPTAMFHMKIIYVRRQSL